MSALQVASGFVVEYFERFAKDPSRLPEFYEENSTVTFSDFEMGVTEKYGTDVYSAITQYAGSLQGSQLRVETVSAASLYSGVNVFVSLTAFNEVQQQYFQITTTLESYLNAQNSESYYIRHQIFARIGVVEAPAAAPVERPVEPAAVPVEEPRAPTPPAVAEAPAKVATPEPEPEPEPQRVPTPPVQEKKPATPAPEVAPAKPAGGRPKSWLELASGVKGSTISGKPAARVVAGDETVAPTAAPVKEPVVTVKKERKTVTAVGDRVMFAIEEEVSDEDIKKALGFLASSLLSLRNLSAKGNVFMDFAEGVAALEELRKNPPTLGKAATKVSVQKQRERKAN